eukprot:TRINITY_DN7046_c0_g1_i1.p2 TRINITY_DN7046_c0_g1~~TRINITY_DN7046_c0_g1_i1.p2  ORF type:complete len:113 (-),score=20.85 TRINITY_DN7046_c0_g1_i1:367-705(-)
MNSRLNILHSNTHFKVSKPLATKLKLHHARDGEGVQYKRTAVKQIKPTMRKVVERKNFERQTALVKAKEHPPSKRNADYNDLTLEYPPFTPHRQERLLDIFIDANDVCLEPK